jgi:predicted anti-sigma-YlaC factor YlaD
MKQKRCHGLYHEFSDYLDGEATELLRAEIDEHMTRCGKCRVVVDTLRKTVTLYHQMPQPELDSNALERIYKVLDISGLMQNPKSQE